jgi:hypothetical protein
MSPRLSLLLADAIVLAHVAFVLFVLLGGLLVVRWRRLAWLHLPAAAWGAWVEFANRVCPLTPLENWLRARGGDSTYAVSFVEQYVMPLLYPAALSRELQWLLGAVVVAVNLGVYAWMMRRRGRGVPPRAR